jgi:ribosomal protein S18 acetylase RimI-like enzyme
MSVALRPATEADVPDLVRLFIMATDGLIEAAYHLVHDVPLETALEWRFTQLGSVKSYEHCWIAQNDRRVTGMINAFPMDDLAHAPSDPHLTPDRLGVLAPVEELMGEANGSYYISAVAVYPQFRGHGIGTTLMAAATADARQSGFTVTSLVSFEQNGRAVALYRQLGFAVTARRPVIPHPLVHHSGDLLLMMRRL